MSALNYAIATNDQLVAALQECARRMHVRDLVVEISPTRGFRIVREGNTAQGICANRHAMIGLLVCLAAIETTATAAGFFGVSKSTHGPDRFWKEVLS